MLGRRSRVVLDTLLPSHAHPGLPVGVLDTEFDTFFADFERQASRPFRVNVRIALWTAVWVSPLLIKQAPPITRLERASREHALSVMGASRSATLRQLLLLLKTIAAVSYGADPRVRDLVGYTRGIGSGGAGAS
jgi:hypothetical protein